MFIASSCAVMSSYVQVQEFTVNLCAAVAVLHTSSGKSYGKLTSVIFDYQQQQVHLKFTGGSNCTSTGMRLTLFGVVRRTSRCCVGELYYCHLLPPVSLLTYSMEQSPS